MRARNQLQRSKDGNGLRSVRVALYARTSRSGQHIDVQLGQLRQVAAQRGWEVVGEFVDDEVSSRRARRPEFERLLAAAHSGGADLVAAVALDRFARSTRELLELGDRLQCWGVDLVSLREQIDTSSAVGRLVFTVLAALAEFERELLRERTLAGLDGARRRGKRFGRPPVPVDTGLVAELRLRGVPWPQIARRVGASESTVRRAMRPKGTQSNVPLAEAQPTARSEVSGEAAICPVTNGRL
jgi:DNA invertase Pin-like site-specific DNA recombinase